MVIYKARYRRLSQQEKDQIIRLYVDGNSLEFIAVLMKTSRTEVYNIVGKADSPGNKIILRHKLLVNLRKRGVDINLYANLYRIRNRLDQKGVPLEDVLSQVRDMAGMCYRNDVPGQNLVWLFRSFTKFLYSYGRGPPKFLRAVLDIWLREAEPLAHRINELTKECNSLRAAIEIIEKLRKNSFGNPASIPYTASPGGFP